MIDIGHNDPGLRQKLKAITDRCDGSDVSFTELVRLIADLNRYHPHSIALIQRTTEGTPSHLRYNCYQHAFALIGIESVNKIMKSTPRIFPGREFARFLILTRLREIPRLEASDGDHIVYSNGPTIQHAGIVRGEAVESKWGLGHLWRHRVFEVPSDYLNNFSFYKSISANDAISAFLDFADTARND